MPGIEQRRVAVFGLGAMGSATVEAMIASGVTAENVFVSDRDREAVRRLADLHGVSVLLDHAQVRAVDAVVLVVTPAGTIELARMLAPHLQPDCLVASLAGGVDLSALSAALPSSRNIVRVMPNLAVAVGAGVFAVAHCRQEAAEGSRHLIRALFSGGGLVIDVSEAELDAVTALSGSGPAYFFYMTEALSHGGVALGLDQRLAEALATQTVVGAAAMLQQSGLAPAELRKRVTSPQGTTAAALDVFESLDLTKSLIAGMGRAAARSGELASAARDAARRPPG